MSDITKRFQQATAGDTQAAAELLPLVYSELRNVARAQMARERAGHTLQATALVHEAYVRLVEKSDANWQGRTHFFAAAAEAMRRILVEHARRKHAVKHGGGRERVELNDDVPAIAAPCDDPDDLLTLNDVLDRLAALAPEKAQVVKLLHFVGLNLDETAAVMGISRSAVYRHWVFARAWLRDAMSDRAVSRDLPAQEPLPDV